MTNDQWFYSQDGRQNGPLPFEMLRQMAGAGQLRPSDMVWSEGMAEWQQAATLQGLFTAPGGGYGAPAGGYAAPTGYAAPAQPQYDAGYYQQQQPAYGYQPAPLGYQGYRPTGQSHNGMAIAGFICALVAPLIGLILSLIALSGMKKSGNREGHGMAVAGVIISICWFGVIILMFCAGFASYQSASPRGY